MDCIYRYDNLIERKTRSLLGEGEIKFTRLNVCQAPFFAPEVSTYYNANEGVAVFENPENIPLITANASPALIYFTEQWQYQSGKVLLVYRFLGELTPAVIAEISYLAKRLQRLEAENGIHPS